MVCQCLVMNHRWHCWLSVGGCCLINSDAEKKRKKKKKKPFIYVQVSFAKYHLITSNQFKLLERIFQNITSPKQNIFLMQKLLFSNQGDLAANYQLLFFCLSPHFPTPQSNQTLYFKVDECQDHFLQEQHAIETSVKHI